MTRRLSYPGWRLSQDEPLDWDDGGIDEIADPDPTASFPQWSRSLLLLLDYAIIEGLQRQQHKFVHCLKLAEAELAKQHRVRRGVYDPATLDPAEDQSGIWLRPEHS